MMKKRGMLVSCILFLIIALSLVSALSLGKIKVSGEQEFNSPTGIISASNLHVGDIFYIDGKKARVTGIKDIVNNVREISDFPEHPKNPTNEQEGFFGFDNLNFFANGVLVHNKFTVPSRPLSDIEKKINSALNDFFSANNIKVLKGKITTTAELNKGVVAVLEEGSQNVIVLSQNTLDSWEIAEPAYNKILLAMGENGGELKRPGILKFEFQSSKGECKNILISGTDSLASSHKMTQEDITKMFNKFITAMKESTGGRAGEITNAVHGKALDAVLTFPNGEQITLRYYKADPEHYIIDSAKQLDALRAEFNALSNPNK